MRVAITPEPEPREREAIERALRRLIAGDTTPPAYRSRWRRASLDFAPHYATARRRSSAGAARA